MALPPSFRRVVVDDTSSSFQYGSSWNQISSASRDASLNSGPAFGGTLHRTTSNTDFSIKFTGSDFVVYSSVDPVVVDKVVQADPQWECIIDGSSLGVSQISQAITFPQNNIDICHGIVSDGPHDLTVRVTSQGNPFYLDNLQYTPSANADLSGTIEKIYNSDPNIQMSSGFKQGTYGVYTTQTKGATVTFKFTGTSLTWVGYIFAGTAPQSSTATWSVDGSAPVSFALATSSISYGNAIFFKTPTLSAGAHTLVVTHQGNANSMPLTFDYFFLGNGVQSPAGGGGGGGGGSAATTSAASGAGTITGGGGDQVTVTAAPTGTSSSSSSGAGTNSTTTGTPATTTGGTSTSAPAGASSAAGAALVSNSADLASTTQLAETTSSAKSNTGAIAGGVVGGVAVLVLLAVAVFFLRRRRSKHGVVAKEPFYRDYEQDGSG